LRPKFEQPVLSEPVDAAAMLRFLRELSGKKYRPADVAVQFHPESVTTLHAEIGMSIITSVLSALRFAPL
jgi:anthranilate/para-aminobenzoate synthase component II